MISLGSCLIVMSKHELTWLPTGPTWCGHCGSGWTTMLPENVQCTSVVGLRIKITFDDQTTAYERISKYLEIYGSQYYACRSHYAMLQVS